MAFNMGLKDTIHGGSDENREFRCARWGCLCVGSKMLNLSEQ